MPEDSPGRDPVSRQSGDTVQCENRFRTRSDNPGDRRVKSVNRPSGPDRAVGSLLVILCVLPIMAAFAMSVLSVTELARTRTVWENFYGRDRNFGGYKGMLIAFPYYQSLLVLGLAHLLAVGIAARRLLRAFAVAILFLAANLLPTYGGLPVIVALITTIAEVMLIPRNILYQSPWGDISRVVTAGFAGAAFGALLGMAARKIQPGPAGSRRDTIRYACSGVLAGIGLALTVSANFGLSIDTPREQIGHFTGVFLRVSVIVGLSFALCALRLFPNAKPAKGGVLMLLACLVVMLYAITHEFTLSLVDGKRSLSNLGPLMEWPSYVIRLLRPLALKYG